MQFDIRMTERDLANLIAHIWAATDSGALDEEAASKIVADAGCAQPCVWRAVIVGTSRSGEHGYSSAWTQGYDEGYSDGREDVDDEDLDDDENVKQSQSTRASKRARKS